MQELTILACADGGYGQLTCLAMRWAARQLAIVGAILFCSCGQRDGSASSVLTFEEAEAQFAIGSINEGIECVGLLTNHSPVAVKADRGDEFLVGSSARLEGLQAVVHAWNGEHDQALALYARATSDPMLPISHLYFIIEALASTGCTADLVERVVGYGVAEHPDRAADMRDVAARYLTHGGVLEFVSPCPLGHGKMECRPLSAVLGVGDCEIAWSHDSEYWRR